MAALPRGGGTDLKLRLWLGAALLAFVDESFCGRERFDLRRRDWEDATGAKEGDCIFGQTTPGPLPKDEQSIFKVE